MAHYSGVRERAACDSHIRTNASHCSPLIIAGAHRGQGEERVLDLIACVTRVPRARSHGSVRLTRRVFSLRSSPIHSPRRTGHEKNARSIWYAWSRPFPRALYDHRWRPAEPSLRAIQPPPGGKVEEKGGNSNGISVIFSAPEAIQFSVRLIEFSRCLCLSPVFTCGYMYGYRFANRGFRTPGEQLFRYLSFAYDYGVAGILKLYTYTFRCARADQARGRIDGICFPEFFSGDWKNSFVRSFFEAIVVETCTFFFVVRVNISQQKQIRLFVKRVSLTRKTQSFFKTLSAFFLVPYKRVLESISNFSCIFPLSPLLNARVTELVNPLSRVAQKNDENCLSITN